mgnify:CR=1 FL=1
MRVASLVLSVAAGLLAPALGQDPAGGPDHPWASWKPGAKVTLQNKNKKGIVLLTTIWTLSEVQPDAVVLSEELAGKSTPRTLRRGEHLACGDPRAERVGEEELTVGDRTYRCVVWRVVLEEGKREEKHWVAPDAPCPLKVESLITLGPVTAREELSARAIGEELEVAGRKLPCVRLEGTQTQLESGSQVAITRWLSAEVPGGLAREVRTKGGAPLAEQVVQAFSGERVR